MYLAIVGAAKNSSIALFDENGKLILMSQETPLTMRVNDQIALDLGNAIDRFCSRLGRSRRKFISDLKSTCVAMSGVIFESDREALKKILAKIGIYKNVYVCEDADAHLAANGVIIGGVIIASTGSNVFYRINDNKEPIRIDGWGSTLGDAGGGYYLGRKCIRTLMKVMDGRLPKTDYLEGIVLNDLQLIRTEDLIEWYYSIRNNSNSRMKISDIAKSVIKAAQKYNDPHAVKILDSGIKELIESCNTSINRLPKEFYKKEFSLILEGGLFNSEKYCTEITKCFLNLKEKYDFNTKINKSKYRAIVGAAVLAYSQKVAFDKSFLENIQKINTNLKIDTNSSEY